VRDVNLTGTTVVETLECRVLLSAASAAARAAAGSIPPGQVLHDFGQQDLVRDAATQADGSTLVLGSTDRTSFDEIGPQYFVARFSRKGRLDLGFGNGGKVVGTLPNFRDAYAIAVAPDGKVVVGGAWDTTIPRNQQFDHQYALARYNPDGSPDTTFGDGGTVHADLDPARSDDLVDLAVLPDGSIVATGIEREPLSMDLGWKGFAVAKFRPDGQLDAAFAQGGVLVSDFGVPGGIATKVAAQPDGKIVVAGATGSDGGEQFAFARLNPDGSRDTSFGQGGNTLLRPSAEHGGYPRGLALLPGGAIVAAGSVTRPAPPSNTGFLNQDEGLVAVVRLTPAGAPDASFGGGDGVVVDGLRGEAKVYDLAAQRDGSLYVAGELDVSAGDFAVPTLLLERYSPAGEHVGSLGVDPRSKVPGAVRRPLIAQHVELTRGGNVSIAGSSQGPSRVALARFRRRGAFDRSFGGNRAVPFECAGPPRGAGPSR